MSRVPCCSPAFSTAVAARRLCQLTALVWLWAGCATTIPIEGLSDDVATDADAATDADTGIAPLPDADSDTGIGPLLTITSPDDGANVNADEVLVEGVASDDSGMASVLVQVGPNVPVRATSDDGFRTWSVLTPLQPGPNTIRVWGLDREGNRGAEDASVLVFGPSLAGGSQPPTLTILRPEDGSTSSRTRLLVAGTASDDAQVSSVQWTIDPPLSAEPQSVLTDDFFASWEAPVTLTPGVTNTLTFTARDNNGQTTSATLTLVAPQSDDRTPPLLEVTSPDAAATWGAPTLSVRGTARDDQGVREVQVLLQAPDGELERATATTSDAWQTWSLDADVYAGTWQMTVIAIDTAGLSATERLEVEVEFDAEWSRERVYTLRARPQPPETPVEVVLDREGIQEVINETIQRQIMLLELDPEGLLTATMDAIKTACGTRWREDSSDPRHDCSLTELGRSFVGPDGTWRTSPEYALVRILNMTPANVKVAGTSIAGLQGLADGAIFGIRIGGGFSQILAETLGIPRTTEIVGTAAVVSALRSNVLATHPNIGEGVTLPITLYDALRDLATMAETLGPVGEHPGIIDPSVPPSGRLFEDAVSMRLRATSNLRWFDGIDLDTGKDYAALVEDVTGPTFTDVVEFDFTRPENFEVTGLVDRPLASLRFRILEDDLFVDSCNGSDTCQENRPGNPVGARSLWSLDPWLLETILAESARVQYSSRRFQKCYIDFLGCQADIRVGQGGEPAGWASFDIIFNLGNPPRDQYAWELITEIAQVAQHNVPSGSIPEGQADVGFNLRDVDVGITAEEIQQAVRPYLQEQRATITDLLLGDWALNNGAVDLFLRHDDSGEPILYFVSEQTPRPSGTYGYGNPGFFSDESFSAESRVSTSSLPGVDDTSHQKWRVSDEPTTLFVQDEDGNTWRLGVQRGAGSDVLISAARRLR